MGLTSPPAVGDPTGASWGDQVANSGYLGDNSATGSTNMTTASQYYAAPSSVTFTLATQRRVRIYTMAAITPASASAAHYFLQPAYNTGAAVGTPTVIGGALAIVTASTLSDGFTHEATVLLAAGTYTAYPAVQRTTGSATDALTRGYVAVYDVSST